MYMSQRYQIKNWGECFYFYLEKKVPFFFLIWAEATLVSCGASVFNENQAAPGLGLG